MRRTVAAALLLIGCTLTAPAPPTEPPAPLGVAVAAPSSIAPPPSAANEHRRVAPSPPRRASRSARPPADPLLAPFPPLTNRHLAELRACENGGRYTSAPGDRYRGAYQAWRDTWRRLWLRLHRPAYAALDPADAPPRVQDAFARWLHRVAGPGQWPACARRLGWLP